MQIWKDIKITLDPNWIDNAYRALSVCYHHEEITDKTDDQKLSAIKRVLSHGHWSVAEAINLSIGIYGAPHDSLMQIRTHRHLSCQVTSQRYTGEQLRQMEYEQLHEHFYFKSIGRYSGRNGKYEITKQADDLFYNATLKAVDDYIKLLDMGIEEEDARRILPQGIRQSMSISCNLRSLLHVIGVRTKKDTQLELREIMRQIYNCLTKNDDTRFVNLIKDIDPVISKMKLNP